jgi:hypothetical protein
MAERRPRRDHYQVQLDYAFDRLLGNKLQQAYELLVPDQVRVIGERSRVMEGGNANRGNLRSGVFGHINIPTGDILNRRIGNLVRRQRVACVGNNPSTKRR